MNKKKYIPVGIHDFKKLILQGYYFADKSLFIKELLDIRSEVSLITRPRRFGKTLNLSMAKYFFTNENGQENQKLFDGLEICRYREYMEYQGKYPVISFTFKDIKELSWKSCYNKICKLICSIYKENQKILTNEKIDKLDRKLFNKIVNQTADKEDYENAIKDLCKYLYKCYNKNVIVIIDEYDMPILAGYNEDYYKEIVSFMRNLLSAVLKDNEYLEFAILTGILRIAKESIFSGLNNPGVFTVLDKKFNYFGFSEKEVETILEYYECNDEFENIKTWYNGYNFGANIVYNPWSILNFIQKKELTSYWINTSQNSLIKKLLQISNSRIKDELEQLIEGNSIDKKINEVTTFENIENHSDNLWSLFLFSGYLTYDKKFRDTRNFTLASLRIPNMEAKILYNSIIDDWFTESSKIPITDLLKALINGNMEYFRPAFKQIVEESLSYFDITGKYPENFYHAFVLGMLINLKSTHYIHSNRESGFGRYDVSIEPKDKAKPGIIFEFKKVIEDETLQEAAQKAMAQIINKNYEAGLRSRGLDEVIKIAISFHGKKCFIIVK